MEGISIYRSIKVVVTPEAMARAIASVVSAEIGLTVDHTEISIMGNGGAIFRLETADPEPAPAGLPAFMRPEEPAITPAEWPVASSASSDAPAPAQGEPAPAVEPFAVTQADEPKAPSVGRSVARSVHFESPASSGEFDDVFDVTAGQHHADPVVTRKPDVPLIQRVSFADKPREGGWTIRRDQELISGSVMGKSDGFIAGKLKVKVPEVRQRREVLKAEYGCDIGKLSGILNAEVKRADAEVAAA